MNRPLRHIEVRRQGDVFCVRLCQPRMAEEAVREMAEELVSLVQEDGCRKLALSLSPSPECLYSVFLTRLVSLQRILAEHDGGLLLCEVEPAVRSIFEACCLDRLFRFVPTFDDAVADWTA
jgi:hypothetical protein